MRAMMLDVIEGKGVLHMLAGPGKPAMGDRLLMGAAPQGIFPSGVAAYRYGTARWASRPRVKCAASSAAISLVRCPHFNPSTAGRRPGCLRPAVPAPRARRNARRG